MADFQPAQLKLNARPVQEEITIKMYKANTNSLCYFNAPTTGCSVKSRPAFVVSYVHSGSMINQKLNEIIAFVDASLSNTNNG